jgi:hypothetical protein
MKEKTLKLTLKILIVILSLGLVFLLFIFFLDIFVLHQRDIISLINYFLMLIVVFLILLLSILSYRLHNKEKGGKEEKKKKQKRLNGIIIIPIGVLLLPIGSSPAVLGIFLVLFGLYEIIKSRKMKKEIKEVHIFIQGKFEEQIGNQMGLEIISELHPEYLSKSEVTKMFVHPLPGEWPERRDELLAYAFGALIQYDKKQSDWENAEYEEGFAFGRNIYLIYFFG